MYFCCFLNKLCAWRHNMPRPARCGPPPVHSLHASLTYVLLTYLRLRRTARLACAMKIHDRQAAARSGRWRRDWSRRYTLCSDLNSQPKRPGDLDLLTLKVVSESGVTWASVPILVFLGLSVLELGPMYATDRQTDRRQTSDKTLLNAPAY